MFKDKYVHVNGVRLHDVTAGKGPLILFLHGFPEFWYEWKDQLAEFGKDHLAVAPDMRGYNLSDKPDGAGSIQDESCWWKTSARWRITLASEKVRSGGSRLGRRRSVGVRHRASRVCWTSW